MIFTMIKRVLLITFFSFSAVVAASQFSNPYQGNVLVGSFDEARLKEMALAQVLVKVSGNRDIAQLDESKRLLRRSQSMLSQYGYRQIEGRDYFSAVFDQSKVNQALRDMQQPVWGDTRPTTLIWLIHNNALVSEQWISQSSDVSLSRALQKSEANRGIAVQFPLMDLDDNLALSVSDVRGRFYDSVSKASARYSRNQFVVAELRTLGGNKWRLTWQLVLSERNSKQQQILIDEQYIGKKSDAMKQMVNSLADYYAGQYAIIENQGDKFTQTLHISGIDTLSEVSKLNTLFENLYAIDSYQISTVEGDKMSIEVKINGGLDSFKNALIAQPHLKLDTRFPVIAESNVIEEPTPEAIDETLVTGETEPLLDEDIILLDEDKVDALEPLALYFIWR